MPKDASAARDDGAIRSAWEAGDMAAATTATLGAYGAEVFGFLVAASGGVGAADEAFSLFSERLWLAFPSFEWGCSVRTWVYLLARNAAADVRRREARHQRRRASSSPVYEIAARIRTETASILKTQKRSTLERLRDELPEEDRMLLILRVDRQLAWLDIARVLENTGRATEHELARESARLRKRFQLVKEWLRARGKELGLL